MNSEVQTQKGFISTNMWNSPYFPSFLFFHLYIQSCSSFGMYDYFTSSGKIRTFKVGSRNSGTSTSILIKFWS